MEKDKKIESDIKTEIRTFLKDKTVPQAASSKIKSEDVFPEQRLDPSVFLEKKDVRRPPLNTTPEGIKEQLKKDYKLVKSHALTELEEENLIPSPLKVDNANPVKNNVQNEQFFRKSKMKQIEKEHALQCEEEHALQCEEEHTLHALIPGSPPYPPRTLGGQEEFFSILAFTVVCIYAVYNKGIETLSPPTQLLPTDYDKGNKEEEDAKGEEVKETETTQIYQSGSLKEDKVTFSTQLNARGLHIGQRWVAMEDVIVFTPDEVLVKKRQIGIVTKVEKGFLMARISFETKNKEYFTGFLEEEGNYLLPFLPLHFLRHTPPV